MIADKIGTFTGLFSGKIINFGDARIDDWVFPLHYRFSCVTIMFASFIMMSAQLFGNKQIMCTKIGKFREQTINQFCWTDGLQEAVVLNRMMELDRMGLTNIIDSTTNTTRATLTLPPKLNVTRKQEIRFIASFESVYLGYYKWVSLTLFLQAAFFIMPIATWAQWEGGRMKALTQELDKPCLEQAKVTENSANLVQYLIASHKLNEQYAARYAACEILSLLNVIGQLIFMETFYGGDLASAASEYFYLLLTRQESYVNLLRDAFPIIAGFQFLAFGPSDGIEKFHPTCILPLNVLNEKIALFLWFWLVLLAILTGCQIVYRMILIVGIQPMRRWFCRSYTKRVSQANVKVLLTSCNYGDLFVLHLLAKNIDFTHMPRIVNQYAVHLKQVKDSRGREIEMLESVRTSSDASTKNLIA